MKGVCRMEIDGRDLVLTVGDIRIQPSPVWGQVEMCVGAACVSVPVPKMEQELKAIWDAARAGFLRG